jgi:hypothetical protein
MTFEIIALDKVMGGGVKKETHLLGTPIRPPWHPSPPLLPDQPSPSPTRPRSRRARERRADQRIVQRTPNGHAVAATAPASRKRLGRLAGWHQHAKQNESLPRAWCQPSSRAFLLSRFQAEGDVVWRER